MHTTESKMLAAISQLELAVLAWERVAKNPGDRFAEASAKIHAAWADRFARDARAAYEQSLPSEVTA